MAGRSGPRRRAAAPRRPSSLGGVLAAGPAASAPSATATPTRGRIGRSFVAHRLLRSPRGRAPRRPRRLAERDLERGERARIRAGRAPGAASASRGAAAHRVADGAGRSPSSAIGDRPRRRVTAASESACVASSPRAGRRSRRRARAPARSPAAAAGRPAACHDRSSSVRAERARSAAASLEVGGGALEVAVAGPQLARDRQHGRQTPAVAEGGPLLGRGIDVRPHPSTSPDVLRDGDPRASASPPAPTGPGRRRPGERVARRASALRRRRTRAAARRTTAAAGA